MDHRKVNQPLAERARAWGRRTLNALLNEEPPGAVYAQGVLPPSMDELRRLVDLHRIDGFLPYESYDPDSQVYWNGDGMCFLLEVAPATGLEESKLRVLAGLFSQGLKEDTTVQTIMYGDPNIHGKLRQWQQARDGRATVRQDMISALAKKRVEYLASGNFESLLSDQPFLIRNWRMFICVTRPGDRDHPDASEIEYLRRTREAFKGILLGAGMEAWEMPPDDFVQLMDGLLNPHPGERTPPKYKDDELLARQVVDAETLYLIGRDSVSTVYKDCQTTLMPFSVRQYPLQWPGWEMGELVGSLLNNTLRFPCPVMFTQTVLFGDQTAAAGNAKVKGLRATQMTDSPMGRFVPAWKDRKRDWDFVINSVEQGHKLLTAHFQIVAFAPHGQEEYCEQRVRAVFDSKGWMLERNRFSVMPSFRSALPMMATPSFVSEMKRLGRLQTFLTWSAINTAPTIAEWKGTESPLLMFFGRRGQLTFFDPFDNKKGNFNIACAATSGAGKSFVTQEFITSTLGTGGRAWVIDAGKSYKNISGVLSSDAAKSFLEFSSGSRLNLNPFTDINSAEFAEEELPMLKQLCGQMASPVDMLDSAEMSYLEQAIVEAWDKYHNEATITAVASRLAAGHNDKQKELAVKLYPYTAKGSHGRFFEGRANVDISSPFVVLELDDLSARPDLQSVVLLSLMLRISEEMYRSARSQRKLCIIDEAWQMMSGRQTVQFIERGYRTARKYGGLFMSVTQGVDDYYKSDGATAALNNADWLLLLRQKPESLAAAANSGRIVMDNSLRELLASVDTVQGKYSEIAIKGPQGVSVGRFIVDPFSEKLYSTKDDEFQFIQDAQKRGMSIADAVEELVKRTTRR